MDLYYQEHDLNPNSSDARRRSSRDPGVSGFGAHILALDLDSLTASAAESYGSESHTNPSPPHLGIQGFTGAQAPQRVTESFLEALLVSAQGNAVNGDGPFSGPGSGGGPPPASDDEIRKLPQVIATSPVTPMTGKSSQIHCSNLQEHHDAGVDKLHPKQLEGAVNTSNTTSGTGVKNVMEEASGKLELVGSCAVCTDDFIEMERVTRLPCGHEFHRDCITTWLKRHCTCPVCRRELRTDNREYEDSKRRRQRDEAASQMRHFMFN